MDEEKWTKRKEGMENKITQKYLLLVQKKHNMKS